MLFSPGRTLFALNCSLPPSFQTQLDIKEPRLAENAIVRSLVELKHRSNHPPLDLCLVALQFESEDATEKLDLASVPKLPPTAASQVLFSNTEQPQYSFMNNERWYNRPLPPLGQLVSSGSLSPRGNSFSSAAGWQGGSQSSYSTAPSSDGPKTPSPTLPLNAVTGPPTTIASFDAMNQGTQDMYYSQSMSAAQPPSHQHGASSGIPYPQQQPPLLQSAHAGYSNPNPYHQYYTGANGLTSPPAAPPPVSTQMGNPQNVLPLPGVGGQGSMPNHYAGFDTTGQHPPPGMKPRVTATLWEDEGSLCFQVEARGICVARREGKRQRRRFNLIREYLVANVSQIMP